MKNKIAIMLLSTMFLAAIGSSAFASDAKTNEGKSPPGFVISEKANAIAADLTVSYEMQSMEVSYEANFGFSFAVVSFAAYDLIPIGNLTAGAKSKNSKFRLCVMKPNIKKTSTLYYRRH